MAITFPFTVTDPRLEGLVDPRASRIQAYNPPQEGEKVPNPGPKGPKSGPKTTR